MLLINKTMLDLSKGLRRYIICIALLKVAVLAATAQFAQNISAFMGNMLAPSMTAADLKGAILSAFFAAAIMLIGELVIGEIEFRCTAKSRILLREKIFSKMLELDVGNIEKIGATRAVTDAVDGVESMQIYYSKYLPGLLYSLLAPIYLFFRLKDVSFKVALMLFAVSFIIMPINNIFRKMIDTLKKEYWGSFSDLTAYYLESLRSLTTIKLFNQENNRFETLKTKAYNFKSIIMKTMKMNFSSFLLTDTMIYASVFIATIMTCGEVVKGNLSLSGALMVLMLSYSFFTAVRSLMNATHQALTGVAAAQNVAEILDIDTSRPYIEADKKENAEGIVLKDVDFSYDKKRKILSDIDIVIEKGKMTAFVGKSGCGKSTIAALLMRFLDADSGEITVDGTNYISISPDELRKNIVMVPQTVTIFTGTIRENLLIANPAATDEEMWQALEDAKLADWVKSLPEGLDTQVGDAGGKLSGGQRQKTGIARALLKNAPYIIFDEATSSVDINSENEIWDCINSLAPKRTPIVISHRLSTIGKADMIYVINGGKVREKGNHRQLMAENGLYKDLVTEQLRLENHGERREENE